MVYEEKAEILVSHVCICPSVKDSQYCIKRYLFKRECYISKEPYQHHASVNKHWP